MESNNSPELAVNAPDPVLALLFSYVPFPERFFLAGVCKRWRHVFSTNALCWRFVAMWRPMQLNCALSAIARLWKGDQPVPVKSASLFALIDTRAHALKSRKGKHGFREIQSCTETDLSELCKWRNLTSLNLHATQGCPVLVYQLFSLPPFLPQLVSLTLDFHIVRHCPFYMRDLDLTAMHSLTTLHASGLFLFETCVTLPASVRDVSFKCFTIKSLHCLGNDLRSLTMESGMISSIPQLSKQTHLHQLVFMPDSECSEFPENPFAYLSDLQTVKLYAINRSAQFLDHVSGMPKLKSVDLDLGSDRDPYSVLTPGLIERLRGLPQQCELSVTFANAACCFNDEMMMALARSAAGGYCVVCMRIHC